MFAARRRLLAVVAALGFGVLAPASALGAVGDLTFGGCIGDQAGCIATNPSTALSDATAVAVSPDGTSVYATSSPGGGSAGAITTFSRNTSTGLLKFAGCIGQLTGCTKTTPANMLDGARSVAVSPDGTSVYTSSGDSSGNEGAIDVFSRNTATGALTYEDCIGADTGCAHTPVYHAILDPTTVVVSPDGTSVYLIGADDDAIVRFSRDPTGGALTFEDCIGMFSGCTATTPANALEGITSIAVSPDGSNVYATNYAFPAIDVLSRNTSTGALAFENCVGPDTGCAASIPTADVGFPYSIALSPDGTSAYVAVYASPGMGMVYSFSRDTSGGGLTYKGCIGNVTGCTTTTPANALDDPLSVEVSPDGDSVYVSNASWEDVLSRAGATGALAFQDCISFEAGCTPTTPTSAPVGPAAISADGSSLYTAGQDAIGEFARVVPPLACTNVSRGTAFQKSVTLALTCSDAEHLPLSFAVVSNPAHGKLGTLSSSGQVTYSPAAGYIGSDSFTYRASDAEGTSNTATATVTVAAPPPQTTSAKFDNQQITLTTPSPLTCTASSKKLSVTLTSTAIKHSKSASLKFSSAAFYIDKGVSHTHKHKHAKTTTSYSANATEHHVPVRFELSLKGLKRGSHKLIVKLSYKEKKREHGHNTTVKVTKTLTAKFSVC